MKIYEHTLRYELVEITCGQIAQLLGAFAGKSQDVNVALGGVVQQELCFKQPSDKQDLSWVKRQPPETICYLLKPLNQKTCIIIEEYTND